LGKAHEPYARSVQQAHALPLNMLPDAGLVFDTLLKREKVSGFLSSCISPIDVCGFSSSSTRPDCPALCSHLQRLSSIRTLDRVFFRVGPVLIKSLKSVFRTSHQDVSINETSSYVDLAPLYGNNEKTLNKIRVRDGRGLLLPDTFAEDRLLLLPPAVCVLLILFNRNHNVRP
jgi:linoleate 10R-lipoxygenase